VKAVSVERAICYEPVGKAFQHDSEETDM
jgi:hypothetical protein